MKLRHPWLIRLFALLGACIIRIWMSTTCRRVTPREAAGRPFDPRSGRNIYAFWHESVLYLATSRAKISVLISRHADGEFIARVCQHLGMGAVRGSSTRGGTAALLSLIKQSRRCHLGVSPDGPRGPRRQVQPGMVFLASLTGLPIVPLGIGFAKAWRAPSWDRLAIPWPWSTVHCVIGAPIHVPPRLARHNLEAYRRLVEEEMLNATHAAERWAASGRRPVNLAAGTIPTVRVSA